MPEEAPQGRKTQLALAVAQGASPKKWAAANNVSRTTAYRWAKELADKGLTERDIAKSIRLFSSRSR